MINNPPVFNVPAPPPAKYNNCNSKIIEVAANTITEVFRANDSRAYATIVVTEGDCCIALGTFVDKDKDFGKGIPLTNKGSSYEINQNNLYVGRVTALAKKKTVLSLCECTFPE